MTCMYEDYPKGPCRHRSPVSAQVKGSLMQAVRKPGYSCFDLVVGEAPVGEPFVDLLQADDGLDVGADAGQVEAVAGGGDPPVLEVPDVPFGTHPNPGEGTVEVAFEPSEVDVRPFLDRCMYDVEFTFVAQVADPAARGAHQLDPAGFAEAVHVMPAPPEGLAGGEKPAVQVDQKLHVHTVAAVLAGLQILAMTPVDGRDEGAVDQADPAGDQRGQAVLVVAAERAGGEGDHRLVVVPRGGRGDAEAFVPVLVGRVAPQPAQRQPHHRRHPRPAGASQSTKCCPANSATNVAARRLNPGRRYTDGPLSVAVESWQTSQSTERAPGPSTARGVHQGGV